MKRIVVLLATLLLSFGLTNAANVVDMQPGTAPWTADTLYNNIPGFFTLSLENDADLGGCSFGFILTSPDGATWTFDEAGGFLTTPAGPKFVKGIAGSRWMNGTAADGSWCDLGGTQVSVPGTDVDSFLIGGAGLMGALATGPLEPMFEVHMTFSGAGTGPDSVVTVCIDSSKYGAAGDFIFVPGGTPAYNQAGKCYIVYQPPDLCPTWTTMNPTITVSHCAVGQTTVNATDPEGGTVYYYLVGTTGAGTATVNMNTGLVSYTPAAADVGAAVTITVEATDAIHQEGGCSASAIDVDVTVGNNAPTITCGASYNPVGKGNNLVKTDINGADADGCDVLTYSIASVTPGFLVAPDINTANGDMTIYTDGGGADNGAHEVCVEVTDGFTTAQCCFTVDVLPVEPWEVQIEKTHQTLQGHFVDVDITLNKGSEAMGGFDFLVAYDASALAFTEASLGSYLQGCGWEYFTYRFNWNGNCGNACPSGLLRLVGMAETNNGPNHPDLNCIKNAAGHVIATLTFFVSNDRTLECMYVPIRFYWMDCGDNTISTVGGDTLAVNRFIYDYVNNMSEIQDYTFGFPGWYGAPDYCLEGDKVNPIRFVDFINGGIDIVCGDSIDARADINANGITYEIADAVMFTNYFISGLSAFGSHVESSIAASDVNADGITLSVADLVYLIRVIVGDANPYPKPMPDAQAIVRAQGGKVTVDAPLNLGAALLTFHVNGEIGEPVLGVDMDMKYAREGDELRVLVYNIGSKAIPAGDNLLVTVPGNVELTGAEVASYDGFTVESSINRLPMAFGLEQNFPNPFNPTTTIALNMPVESDYSITIFNVAGQKVREFAGHSAAGVLNVVWDGTDANGSTVASGIYFYRASADKFSETKKMVLMK